MGLWPERGTLALPARHGRPASKDSGAPEIGVHQQVDIVGALLDAAQPDRKSEDCWVGDGVEQSRDDVLVDAEVGTIPEWTASRRLRRSATHRPGTRRGRHAATSVRRLGPQKPHLRSPQARPDPSGTATPEVSRPPRGSNPNLVETSSSTLSTSTASLCSS